MKIAINSGLGDMVNFLPFAVQLSKKQPFEIVGNKYSKEICDLAGLTNVTHDTTHTVLIPPPGAIVARLKRYGGNGNYREIYAKATGCDGDKAECVPLLYMAFGMEFLGSPLREQFPTLILDGPRKSGLGSDLYTPSHEHFFAELEKIKYKYPMSIRLAPKMSMRDLFYAVAIKSAGFGQIGFLTALCQLFNKPFYPVKGADEPQEKFELRKKAVCLD